MSIFKRKQDPDTSQGYRIIRFAIEDQFAVPASTSDGVIEGMIAKVAKDHDFIWTDDIEESLFDFGDDDEEDEE